jgi:hypothetical protein
VAVAKVTVGMALCGAHVRTAASGQPETALGIAPIVRIAPRQDGYRGGRGETPRQGTDMAGKNDQYETTTVRRQKQAEKLVREGWEVVTQSGKENWVMGSDLQITLRRPNPNYKGVPVAAPVATPPPMRSMGWYPDQQGRPGIWWYWDGIEHA